MSLVVMFNRETRRGEEFLLKHPEADVVLLLDLVVNEPGRYVLYETSGSRTGPWTERTRTFDSEDSLRAEGLNIELGADSHRVAIVGLESVWLRKGKLKYSVLYKENGVFLLREVKSVGPEGED